MQGVTMGLVRLAVMVWALGAGMGAAQAEVPQILQAPEAILQITADFDKDGQTETRSFTQQDLAALGEESFDTATIWTEGEQRFTGLRLRRLLDHLGVEAQAQVTLVAVNDYQITMPASEATPGGALLAYLRNGTAMSLRDKGPLWLVYPYNSSDVFRTEVVYSRSVWQLAQIIVSP